MIVFCIGKTEKHISFTKKTFSFLFIFLVFVIVSVVSCTAPDKFTIGEDIIESQTDLKIIDTFKVDLSTVLLDSLATSGTGVVLVGDSKDEEFGSVGSKSYFELAYPTFPTLSNTSVFDSAAFILSYSRYNYGDTTALMSVGIHQLTERITLNESGYLYNNSSVAYSSEVLGTKLFYPRPESRDTIVSIPVNEFGKTFYRLIKTKDEVISTEDLFFDHFKGFAITSESGNNNAIIGFSADTNHLSLKIYYHIDKDVPDATERVIKIPFGTKSVQFNGIQYDLSKTMLNKLNATDNVVLSSQTGNKAFLQGMIGLIPKVQFPTMQNILLENRWKIVKAELVIAPVNASYSLYKLPTQLYLYNSDKQSDMNSLLTLESGTTVVSSLNVDDLYNENTRYTFDITFFMTSELSDSYFDYDHGILIGLKQSEFLSTFGRMLIEGKNPAVKLRLYYLTY